jgi:type I restriction enzyme, S subunit
LIGDVAGVVGGGTPRTSEASHFDDGQVPWITPADLSGYAGKYIGHGSRNITATGLANSGARLLPTGTVLFSSRAPIGYVSIAANPVATNQGFKSFIFPPGIAPEYAYYFLKRAKELAMALASGTTFQEVSGRQAAKIPFAIAPLPEQHRIVEALESYFTRLDDAVATLERVQRNLKRYRASALKAAVEGRLVPTEAELARAEGRSFEPASVLLKRILDERRRRWEEAELAKMKAKGKSPKDDNWKAKYVEPVAPDTADLPQLPDGWCWTTWDQVAERVTVGHVGKMKDEYISTGVPFLRGGNVRPNRYDPGDLKYVSRDFHERLSKSALAPGDVLIVRSGAVGTACVVPEALHEANCSDLVVVRGPIGIVPQFGAYYMNSLAQATVRSQQVGVALIHFNTRSAASLSLPLAPASEQKRIVACVDKQMSVISELESQSGGDLRSLARLRQSILKWAFEGRLVDQDPSDEPAERLLERIRAEREAAAPTPARRPRRPRQSAETR